MSELSEIAEVSAKGSFELFVGYVVSTIISAVGTILVARLLTDIEYGLLTVVIIPPMMLSVVRNLGVNSAIIRFTARYRAEGEEERIRSVILSGLLFEALMGVAFSAALAAFSKPLAVHVFHRPQAVNLMRLASLLVLADSLFTFSISVFTGFEEMKNYSFMLALRSILRATLAPLLVFLGFGPLGALLGFIAAYTVSAVFGTIISLLRFFRSLPAGCGSSVLETLREMLDYGLPLCVVDVSMGLLPQLYGFILAANYTDVIMGNYQVAMNFLVISTFFKFPVATTLFPAFSKVRENRLLKSVFSYSVKYSALMILPVMFAMVSMSEPMVYTLFGGKYTLAPGYLSMLAFIHVYVGCGLFIIGPLFRGVGETRMFMKLTLLRVCAAVVLAVLLIPRLCVLGLALTLVLNRLFFLIPALKWLRDRLSVTVDWPSSAKIYASSIAASAPTYAFTLFTRLNPVVELIVGGLLFVAVYILSVCAVGAVDVGDLDNLDRLSTALGPFSPLARLLISALRRGLSLSSSLRTAF